MRNIFLVLALIFFVTLSSSADSWNDFSNVDRLWDGQKTITNQEFEQVMEKLEEKDKQKEVKQKKKKRKKLFGNGTTLHSELNPDNTVAELDSLALEDENLLLNTSIDLIYGNIVFERGFYNVVGEKDKQGKCFISLYQSQYLIGKIELTPIDDDFGEEMLNFVKIIPCNNDFVKLIFGSIDFNGYAYLPYRE